MKKLVCVVMTAVAMSAFAEMKIAVVDMMALLRYHPSYESNRNILKETDQDFQKKVDLIRAEVEQLQEEGTKLGEQLRNPMLASSAKTKIEKDLVELQNKYVAGQQKLRSEAMRCQQELQAMEGRFVKVTTEDLKKRLAEYAKQNGYDIILDAGSTPYAKTGLDITEAIVTSMGGKYEKPSEEQATEKTVDEKSAVKTEGANESK